MTGDGCRAELFSERYREPLKAACAEDNAIWQIYANNFGPDGFDDSVDRYVSNPANRTFVLFDGDELAGMPGKDGLVHVSEIKNERVENVRDVLSEGQEVKVKLLEVDPRGKVRALTDAPA